MHRLMIVAVIAACGGRSPVGDDGETLPDAGEGPNEPPARLPDTAASPFEWELGAPLAPGVVSGRIYEDLAANIDDRLRDLAALGVRIVRIEIERDTSWSTYQTIVDAARRAGIEILAVVSQNSLAPGTPDVRDGTLAQFDAIVVPAYLAALDEMLAMLDVKFIEVWNEPDVYEFGPLFAFPPCTRDEGATRYALLAVRVFETIDQRRRNGQATPTLAAFGVSRQDDGCVRESVFDSEPIRNHRLGYRPQHGLADGLPTDIVAMHGYGNGGKAPFESGYTYAGGTFADGVDELLNARFADGARVITQPVWYTEVGYSLNSIGGDAPARQAAGLATVFATLRARPQITAAFWYGYRDDEAPGEERCGLRDASTTAFAPHPAYVRMQEAAAAFDRGAPHGALAAEVGSTIRATGWAIDADGAAPTIELAIDGEIVATVVDGAVPDSGACTIAHSVRCPDVGFAVELPLPARGVHELAARARDATGNARVIGRVDVRVP